MRTLCAVATFFVLMALASCGSARELTSAPQPASAPTPLPNPTPASTPVPPGGPYQDNWQFMPSTEGQSLTEMRLAWNAGALNISGAAMILNNGSGCFLYTTDGTGLLPLIVPLTGPVNSNGDFSVATLPYQGQSLSLMGGFSSDPSILDVSYSGSGTCAGALNGQLHGTRIQPLTGTYAGTLKNDVGDQLSTTVQLVQAPQTDVADGYFHFTGRVTITGTKCSGDYVLEARSTILGNHVSLASGELALGGHTVPDGSTLYLESYPYSDDCSAGSTGTLNRQ